MLGRSGSGKSTLLHLLGGLDSPDRGEIVLAGERLTGRSARALARIRLRHVGFVFQQFQLIEELSGAENVLMPTRLPGAPAGGARRAAELIEELGLSEVAGHLPHELSGGEQQRFAFARALVNGPRLVLADEPTGSLDRDSGAVVLELLRGLTGCAVVIVTHEPDAAGIADRRAAPRRREATLGGLGGRSTVKGLTAALYEARQGLRLRRRQTLLTAMGIALAAAMLAAALVVGVGLGGGFDRAARAADLPDVIVRFDPQSAPAGGRPDQGAARYRPRTRYARR